MIVNKSLSDVKSPLLYAMILNLFDILDGCSDAQKSTFSQQDTENCWVMLRGPALHTRF
jgi:hypothetical protein